MLTLLLSNIKVHTKVECKTVREPKASHPAAVAARTSIIPDRPGLRRQQHLCSFTMTEALILQSEAREWVLLCRTSLTSMGLRLCRTLAP